LIVVPSSPPHQIALFYWSKLNGIELAYRLVDTWDFFRKYEGAPLCDTVPHLMILWVMTLAGFGPLHQAFKALMLFKVFFVFLDKGYKALSARPTSKRSIYQYVDAQRDPNTNGTFAPTPIIRRGLGRGSFKIKRPKQT
jgi:hypothetical protein